MIRRLLVSILVAITAAMNTATPPGKGQPSAAMMQSQFTMPILNVGTQPRAGGFAPGMQLGALPSQTTDSFTA